MEIKEIKIEVPEGYEIDKEKSTFERIIFKVKKELTYDDIANIETHQYALLTGGNIDTTITNSLFSGFSYGSTASTKEQLESILALNKLCNVAKHLNGDWLPGLVSCYRYSIRISTDNKLFIEDSNQTMLSEIYFKTHNLAQKAIDILTEPIIRKALTLNH